MSDIAESITAQGADKVEDKPVTDTQSGAEAAKGKKLTSISD
jgi:hypothetical protein